MKEFAATRRASELNFCSCVKYQVFNRNYNIFYYIRLHGQTDGFSLTHPFKYLGTQNKALNLNLSRKDLIDYLFSR